MKRERRSSHQTLLLLGALRGQPRSWCHGYDLAAQTGLKSGTLYSVLMGLSDRGYLESKWEPSEMPGRPPRRMHRLTAKGIAFAREELAASDEVALQRAARVRT